MFEESEIENIVFFFILTEQKDKLREKERLKSWPRVENFS